MSTSVKVFDSGQAGAPVLSGTAGALRTILKACLVDGFGAGAVNSLVVANGSATATFTGQHPYKVGTVMQIAGATPSGLNGLHRVSSITSGSATFAAQGVPDGDATGTVTHRVAPAGWEEVFAGQLVNVMVVRPTAVEATGCLLRIDDSGSINARVRAFETMSDISSGSGLTPLDTQLAGGLWWPKSGASDASVRPWMIVADDLGFFFAVAPQGADRYTLLYAGDVASFKSGDAYRYLVTGNSGDQTGTTFVPDGCCGWSHRSGRGGAYLVRSHTGIGGSLAAQRLGAHHNGSAGDVYAGTSGYSVGAYPNPANNGLMTGSLELYALGLRGALPGLLHPVHDLSAAFATGAVVAGTDDFLGRSLLAVRVAPPSGSVVPGTVFIDATGPWVR